MPNCYYYDEQRNRCNCYVNENLNELLAENVKLQASNEVIAEDHAALCEQNAKLRELCKDMMAFVEDDDACERCGHDAECVEAADGELVLPYEGRCLMLDLFADRMRELGIEVNDG